MELLPHDEQAEKTVLGEILIGGIVSYAKELQPGDFYTDKHQVIFKAMQALQAQNEPIDLITLGNYLENKIKKAELDKMGGAVYLTDLADQAISTSSMPAHVKIVKEESIKRQIIQIGAKAKGDFKDTDISQIISEMKTFYTDLALTPAMEDIGWFDMDKLYQEGKDYARGGKKTGIAELDKAVKIMPKELIIIQARPGHGKSSFAYNLLLNFIEAYEDEAFLFFNLDMPSVNVMTRLATIWAKKHKNKGYAYKDLFPMFQDQETFPQEIKEAFFKFDNYGKEKRLAVINTPRYTVEQLIGHAERLSKDKPIGAIFIDYMELVNTRGKKDTEELRIAYIANQLRIASEALSTPIIVLAQTNRAGVGRPKLESIRYSGRQEQEATTVLGLFNKNQGEEESKKEADQDPDRYLETETDFQVEPLKNRGGYINRVIELNFEMESGYISAKESTGRFNSS
ncbi:MAG: hypothetical protein KAX15_03990 [Candidatus Omnitrophica bacterium]|nr:hypothetical protein [Candidatus Omnitrophota bacterium]